MKLRSQESLLASRNFNWKQGMLTQCTRSTRLCTLYSPFSLLLSPQFSPKKWSIQKVSKKACAWYISNWTVFYYVPFINNYVQDTISENTCRSEAWVIVWSMSLQMSLQATTLPRARRSEHASAQQKCRLVLQLPQLHEHHNASLAWEWLGF